MEKKKNEKGKGEKYLVGEGRGRKYLEKEENIKRRKVSFFQEEKKNGKGKGEGKYLFSRGEGKGGKYLDEENISKRKIFGPQRRRSGEKEKEESFGEGKLMVTPTNRQPSEYRAICLFEIRNWKKGRDFQNTQCRTESWEYFQIV